MAIRYSARVREGVVRGDGDLEIGFSGVGDFVHSWHVLDNPLIDEWFAARAYGATAQSRARSRVALKRAGMFDNTRGSERAKRLIVKATFYIEKSLVLKTRLIAP